jgi:hypothetical protein
LEARKPVGKMYQGSLNLSRFFADESPRRRRQGKPRTGQVQSVVQSKKKCSLQVDAAARRKKQGMNSVGVRRRGFVASSRATTL